MAGVMLMIAGALSTTRRSCLVEATGGRCILVQWHPFTRLRPPRRTSLCDSPCRFAWSSDPPAGSQLPPARKRNVFPSPSAPARVAAPPPQPAACRGQSGQRVGKRGNDTADIVEGGRLRGGCGRCCAGGQHKGGVHRPPVFPPPPSTAAAALERRGSLQKRLRRGVAVCLVLRGDGMKQATAGGGEGMDHLSDAHCLTCRGCPPMPTRSVVRRGGGGGHTGRGRTLCLDAKTVWGARPAQTQVRTDTDTARRHHNSKRRQQASSRQQSAGVVPQAAPALATTSFLRHVLSKNLSP